LCCGRSLGPARIPVLAKPFTIDQIRRDIKEVFEGGDVRDA
jgi:hypothetical protein